MTEKVNQPVDSGNVEAGLDSRAQAEAAAASETESTEATNDIDELRAELAAAKDEAAANYDKFIRTRAEMENFRKRIERTYADTARSGKKELLRKLLTVQDNLERALQYGEQEAGNRESIMEGVRLTQYQLEQLLSQEGVKPIEAEGRQFDPRLDEAVHRVDDPNVPDHTVVQVVRRGYIYQTEDDVLRPAQVVVSVHSSEE